MQIDMISGYIYSYSINKPSNLITTVISYHTSTIQSSQLCQPVSVALSPRGPTRRLNEPGASVAKRDI